MQKHKPQARRLHWSVEETQTCPLALPRDGPSLCRAQPHVVASCWFHFSSVRPKSEPGAPWRDMGERVAWTGRTTFRPWFLLLSLAESHWTGVSVFLGPLFSGAKWDLESFLLLVCWLFRTCKMNSYLSTKIQTGKCRTLERQVQVTVLLASPLPVPELAGLGAPGSEGTQHDTPGAGWLCDSPRPSCSKALPLWSPTS